MEQQKVIAVDFDGTLCENAYPDIGKPIDKVITYIKSLRAAGNILILWTCREGGQLDEAIGWCNAHGLKFDHINENCARNMEEYQNNCRKVAADIYIDDRAMRIRDIPKRRRLWKKQR